MLDGEHQVDEFADSVQYQEIDDGNNQCGDERDNAPCCAEKAWAPWHLFSRNEPSHHLASKEAHQQHTNRRENPNDEHDPGQNLPDGANGL
jgi:hypothetical protein